MMKFIGLTLTKACGRAIAYGIAPLTLMVLLAISLPAKSIGILRVEGEDKQEIYIHSLPPDTNFLDIHLNSINANRQVFVDPKCGILSFRVSDSFPLWGDNITSEHIAIYFRISENSALRNLAFGLPHPSNIYWNAAPSRMELSEQIGKLSCGDDSRIKVSGEGNQWISPGEYPPDVFWNNPIVQTKNGYIWISRSQREIQFFHEVLIGRTRAYIEHRLSGASHPEYGSPMGGWKTFRANKCGLIKVRETSRVQIFSYPNWEMRIRDPDSGSDVVINSSNLESFPVTDYENRPKCSRNGSALLPEIWPSVDYPPDF